MVRAIKEIKGIADNKIPLHDTGAESVHQDQILEAGLALLKARAQFFKA